MGSSSMITDPPQNKMIDDALVEIEKSREQYPIILSQLLTNTEQYSKEEDQGSIIECFNEASNMAVDKIKKLAQTMDQYAMATFLTGYVSKTILSDLFKQHNDVYARMVVNAVVETQSEINDSDSDFEYDSDADCGDEYGDHKEPEFIGIHKVRGGKIGNSCFVQGVVFKNTLSCVGQQLKKDLSNPKILLLDVNHLQLLDNPESDKEKAETRFINGCSKCGATIILSTSTFSDEATKFFFEECGITCISSVAKDDLRRVADATGARVVKSFDSFLDRALGTPGEFVEVEYGSDVFSVFRGCSIGKTATIVVYEADKFTKEEEEVLRDEIMFVRRALKDSTVVNGRTIYLDISRYLKQKGHKVGGDDEKYMDIFANALEVTSAELLSSDAADPTIILEPAVLKIEAVIYATLYVKSLLPFGDDEDV